MLLSSGGARTTARGAEKLRGGVPGAFVAARLVLGAHDARGAAAACDELRLCDCAAAAAAADVGSVLASMAETWRIAGCGAVALSDVRGPYDDMLRMGGGVLRRVDVFVFSMQGAVEADRASAETSASMADCALEAFPGSGEIDVVVMGILELTLAVSGPL